MIGAYFAEMAELEAASVTAFRRLARELAWHGAPQSLRRAARRTARDEIAHTRITRTLARRFGGKPVTPRITAVATRSLEAIASENAVEGCVRETFGALLATHQARASADPEVRRALRRIARDEVRHAALAWKIADWAENQLDHAAQTRVEQAMREAAATLIHETEGTSHPALTRIAGLPTQAELHRMATELSRAIWS